MRILVVEDDRQLAEMLTEALRDCQYVVDIAPDGEIAWHYLETLPYDLAILDVTLPKLDGIHLCKRVRQSNLTLPILMLTARDTIGDRITGLDAGADDYVVKPFNLQELMARVRALLRRGSATPGTGLQWGLLTLNAGTFEAQYNGQPLPLTPKEFSLLELLLANGRRVLSRTGIIEHLWSLDNPPTEETVKSHIKGLRQKLKQAGAPDDLVETVHGLGYRLKQIP